MRHTVIGYRLPTTTDTTDTGMGFPTGIIEETAKCVGFNSYSHCERSAVERSNPEENNEIAASLANSLLAMTRYILWSH
ncbi:MAG: hypothetical protein V1723_02335 [Candidatus Uhrbacteria bacterium]